MSDFSKNPADMPGKLSPRNFLRNAALAVTSLVVMLMVLTGCTKDEIQPGGGLLGGAPNAWYKIKVNYRTTKGNTAEGYLSPIGRAFPTKNWDEMQVDNSTGMKFKRHPAPEKGVGFEYLETEDGYWLTLSYIGWVYRDTEKEIAWKIVDGKLQHSYGRWEGYAIGAQERGGLVTNPFNVQAYYAGVGLGDENILTNVKFEPVP